MDQTQGAGHGQYLDTETTNYHLRARQYDPATGRFGAIDPVENPAVEPSASAYGYVIARPLVLVDPLGLFWRELGETLAGGADTVTFGGSTRALEAMDVDVNTDSNYFKAGQIAGSFAGPGGLTAAITKRVVKKAASRLTKTAAGAGGGAVAGASSCLIRGAVSGNGCSPEQAATEAAASALGGGLFSGLSRRCPTPSVDGRANVIVDTNAIFNRSGVDAALRSSETPVVTQTTRGVCPKLCVTGVA